MNSAAVFESEFELYIFIFGRTTGTRDLDDGPRVHSGFPENYYEKLLHYSISCKSILL